MRRSYLLALPLALSCSFLLPHATGAQSTPAAPAASAKKTCPVNIAKPTEADVLLARESFEEADKAYRAMLDKDADDEEAHLGLVRALIGEDKVDDAKAEAAKMLKQKPASPVAETATAEVAYRAADLDEAFKHGRQALVDNLCDARADAFLGDYYSLSGFFARAATLYNQAHRLRPNDELIRRDWLATLPRDKRQVELDRYLQEKPPLSKDDEVGLNNELQHLKARKPGECRIVSSAQTTTTKMQPVFGDNSSPVAFGLDVSLNGKRRRMQIDTGASGILLTEGSARALNLKPEFHLKSGGVGDDGERESFLTHVDSIKIGDIEIANCMVEVIAKSKLDVDGLIGMDVFRRWLVTLDYQGAEVRLAPLPARPGAPSAAKLESDPLPGDVGDEDDTPHDAYIADSMKDWLSVPRIGHELLLASRSGNGPIHYLMMDTGAGLSNLSVGMAREHGKLQGSPTRIFGISGEVKKVYETNSFALQVENLRLPPQSYIAYDMTKISHNSGFEVSGLLGLPTLQRLTISIDYRDNLLKLHYDPNRDRLRF